MPDSTREEERDERRTLFNVSDRHFLQWFCCYIQALERETQSLRSILDQYQIAQLSLDERNDEAFGWLANDELLKKKNDAVNAVESLTSALIAYLQKQLLDREKDLL
jgi:hypothetical protein